MKLSPGTGEVRKSRWAGQFYSDKKEILRQGIKQYFSKAIRLPDIGRILGLIVPHAGYMYSGQVAADAYVQLEGKRFRTVIVVSPSHRDLFRGISVFTGKCYDTVFGEIAIDQHSAQLLVDFDDLIQSSWLGHREEHALEVQLPFLSMILGDFLLVPVVIGEQNISTCRLLAEALTPIVSQSDVLVVASSDLSHFYSYDEAVSLDNVVIDMINSFDPESLWESLESKKCFACGGGPMVTVLIAAKNAGAHHTKVISYKNSGDVTGDMDRVVGYLSAVIYD